MFGKLAALMAFLSLGDLGAAILLLLVRSRARWQSDVLQEPFILWFPAITVFSSIQVTTAASAMLALSSLSKSSRYVGILYAALIFFSEAIFGVLQSRGRQYELLVDFDAFRCESGRRRDFPASVECDTPWPLSAAMIVALVVVSGIVFERRVRGVEVVA